MHAHSHTIECIKLWKEIREMQLCKRLLSTEMFSLSEALSQTLTLKNVKNININNY